MRYAVDKQHRDFFRKTGYIELEGLFPSAQRLTLNESIDNSLAVRCNIPLDKVSLCPAEQQFLAGRDLWRDTHEVRKLMLHGSLSELVEELIEERAMRIGYDQLFPILPKRQTENVYSHYLKQSGSLIDISPISGLLCGILIPLSPEEMGEEAPTTTNLFACKPGNAVFFQPQVALPFDTLFSLPRQRYLLCVYAQSNATYMLQSRDPHTHAWKRLGYRVGERLNDKFHPLVR